jgi:hypothetical protein
MIKKNLFYVAILLSVLNIYQAIVIVKGIDIISVSILLSFFRLWFYSRLTLGRDFMTILIAIYIEVGLILSPLINISTSLSSFVEMDSNSTMVIIGSILLLSHIVINKFFRRTLKSKKDISSAWRGVCIKRVNLYILIWAFMFLIAILINYYFQISILGKGSKALPFQLGGVVIYFKYIVAPAFFFILLDVSYEKKLKKQIYFLFILMVFLVLLDSMIRMSKAGLLVMMVPIIFWMIYRRISFKKYILILLIPFAILLNYYQVIGEYRRGVDSFNIVQFIEFSDSFESQQSMLFVLNLMYNRVFLDTNMIRKSLDYNDGSFVYNNYDKVSEAGGVIKYHTHIIDNLPLDMIHSSGSSMFGGSFMIGGLWLSIFTLVIFSTLSVFFDKGRMGYISITYSGKVIFVLFVYGLLSGGFWNYLSKDIEVILVWPLVFLMHNYFVSKYSS